MTYKVEKVGDKGEVVIGEELREKLGIGPGWFAYRFKVNRYRRMFTRYGKLTQRPLSRIYPRL